MVNYPTIIQYLIRKFIWYVLLTLLVFLALLFVAEAFEVLQKFRSTYFSSEEFWLLITLKIPYLFNEVSTIIGLISTVLFLQSLATNNELIIITSSGIPIWRILLVPVILSFLLGVVITLIINPISTYCLKEYDKLEAKLRNTVPQGSSVISSSGVFFYEKYQNTNRIIQATSINAEQKLISGIVMLVTDMQNELVERIDASSATLDNGLFDLQYPTVYKQNQNFHHQQLLLPTNLSINNLIQSFVAPEMISIWQLPDAIEKINNSGLPTLSWQIHFFKQLFKPLAMSAMTLLACWFINLNNRSRGNIKNIIFSVFAGLIAYFLLEITLRLLSFGGLSPMLATLLPIMVIILISNFVILHLQEA